MKSKNKKPINFRLSHRSLLILVLLEEKLHASKTAVVEEALQCLADQKLKLKNPLMKYAGILSSNESDDILSIIKHDRRNKTIKVKL